MATTPSTSPSPSSNTTQDDHDNWFRTEVEKTLARLKDGSATLISEEEHDLRWQEKRAALLAASRKPG